MAYSSEYGTTYRNLGMPVCNSIVWTNQYRPDAAVHVYPFHHFYAGTLV